MNKAPQEPHPFDLMPEFGQTIRDIAENREPTTATGAFLREPGKALTVTEIQQATGQEPWKVERTLAALQTAGFMPTETITADGISEFRLTGLPEESDYSRYS